MANEFSARMVAYNLDGSRRGVVVSPLGMTWTDAAGGLPTLKTQWTRAVPSHRLLEAPVMVALETRVKGMNLWREERNARFITVGQDYDRKDPTQAVSSSLAGMLSVMAGASVGTDNLDAEGRRTFTGVNPGTLVRTLVDAAQDRGLLTTPAITCTFDGTQDSLGNAWSATYDKLTRSYEPSTDLRTILQDLWSTGSISFWFTGTELNVTAAGVSSAYRYNGPGAVWLRDSTIPSSPEKESYADVATRFILLGDSGFVYRYNETGVPAVLGARERYVSAAGVSDAVTAKRILQREAARVASVARTYTREWTYTDDAVSPYLPGRDFFTGDWLYVDTVDGHKQRMQVADYSVSIDKDGVAQPNVTLGMVRDGPTLRTVKQQRALNRGATPLGVGSARPPAVVPSGFGDKLLADAAKYTDDKIAALPPPSSGGSGGPALTFDQTPIDGSQNPVTSDGIYDALTGKQDKLSFDSSPIAGSSRPVTSGGVHKAIADAVAKIPFGLDPNNPDVGVYLSGIRMDFAIWAQKYEDMRFETVLTDIVNPGARGYSLWDLTISRSGGLTASDFGDKTPFIVAFTHFIDMTPTTIKGGLHFVSPTTFSANYAIPGKLSTGAPVTLRLVDAVVPQGWAGAGQMADAGVMSFTITGLEAAGVKNKGWTATFKGIVV